MQIIEPSNEGVAITNVALASLRVAVAQQEQFSKMLVEIVKSQEKNFEQESRTADEQVKAKQPDKVEAEKKPVSGSGSVSVSGSSLQNAVDDKRGATVNIKA